MNLLTTNCIQAVGPWGEVSAPNCYYGPEEDEDCLWHLPIGRARCFRGVGIVRAIRAKPTRPFGLVGTTRSNTPSSGHDSRPARFTRQRLEICGKPPLKEVFRSSSSR